jgi:hypothetical protein
MYFSTFVKEQIINQDFYNLSNVIIWVAVNLLLVEEKTGFETANVAL